MNPMKRKKLFAMASQKAAMTPAVPAVPPTPEELAKAEEEKRLAAELQAIEEEKARIAAAEAKKLAEIKLAHEQTETEKQRLLMKQQYKEAEKRRRENLASERGVEFDVLVGEDPEDVKREALRELAKEDKS